MIRRRSSWPPDIRIEAELGRLAEAEIGPLDGVAQGWGLDRFGLPIEDFVEVRPPGALDLPHARFEGELEVALRPLAMEARSHPDARVRACVAVEQVEDGAAQDQRVPPSRRERRAIALAQPGDHRGSV